MALDALKISGDRCFRLGRLASAAEPHSLLRLIVLLATAANGGAPAALVPASTLPMLTASGPEPTPLVAASFRGVGVCMVAAATVSQAGSAHFSEAAIGRCHSWGALWTHSVARPGAWRCSRHAALQVSPDREPALWDGASDCGNSHHGTHT